LRQARDISAKVLGFVARQLHVWHLGMRIHQELCDFTPIESRFPCDCREGRSAVRATFLIVGDDVTGRAPVSSELLSAGRLGGHRGRARDRSPHAESQRRVTPKGQRPVAGDVADDVASCPAEAQVQCSSADRDAAGIVLACLDTAGQDCAAAEVRDSIDAVWRKIANRRWAG
jgi:hypothetical protein